MKRPPYPSTPDEARQWFVKHGICIADWAKHHKVSRYTVFDLLREKRKGLRGETHKTAILLGLKPDPEGLDERAA